MVEIEIVYEGDLHTAASHGPSRATLATDAPKDNEGRGETFSPTDLLATALGSCVLTTMGIVARRHGWPLEGGRARVEKHMVTGPGRRVARLVVDLALPAAVPEEARPVLERAAHTCPVHRSLHPDVHVELRFGWSA
ncbi:MAG: OsmC family protein [Myxococcota bacterium]|nr:OsmC family protein [Myxococcota bacterium]